jgi:glycosyltransferase involved in cell wall biosynthesis
MQEVRLLVFIPSLAGGGAERVTTNLANHWAGEGWDITIVTLAPQHDDLYALHPTVKRIALNLSGESRNALVGLMQNLRRVVALREVIRTARPDAALGMMTSANVLLALAAWKLPVTRIIGAERTHPPGFPLSSCWEWLRRHAYGRLTAVVGLTHQSADWIKAHTAARQVLVIPNPSCWPLAREALHIETQPFCRVGRKRLLAVGRLSAEKQFGLLVGSFKCLSSRYPEWDLVVLGDGPLRSELQARVWAADLNDRVFLPGRAGNIGEWYERSDIYVLSSRFEGFPNALIEAMAYGLPAVSFDCDTGPRDIIRHEVDGLLVPPGDATGLTSALNILMGDAIMRQRFAARAIDVRERFSMERITGMWESLFIEARK